ncbi:MAG TPA: hypothetical protein VLW06_02070 [Terriglobales bacterium]|nr:hypothetical protein [Terriglobales bacterium]
MNTAILIVALFGAFSVPAVAASSERFDDFSKQCGLSQDSKSRIFAAADGEHWKEYPSLDKIPERNIDWSEAGFLERNGQTVATEIDGVGQDFSDSSLYCFDDHGKLGRIEREFTTAWGWGYAETDTFKNETVSSHLERYFDTKTHAVIPRPADYNDVHDAMKLKIYTEVKELPFYNLM